MTSFVPPPTMNFTGQSVLPNQRNEVAFVDTGVADWRTLVAGIPPGIEIVLLDSERSGLDQLAEWAAGHHDYDAIHLFSHGSEGAIRLGNNTLTQESLSNAYVQGQLSAFGQSVKAKGELLIYGCSVAGGKAGRSFIAELEAITGATVAASEDVTSSIAYGGNWLLEVGLNEISTTPLEISSFSGTLAAPVLQSDTAPDDGRSDYTLTVFKNSDQNTVYDNVKYFVNGDNAIHNILGIDITSGGYNWSVTANPTHGTLVNNLSASTSSGSPDGTLYYVPTAGYTGTDSLTVQVSGPNGTDSMSVDINVVDQHVIGGVAATGNLLVTITGGQIYTERYNGTAWEKQYFAASGALIDLNSTLFAFGPYYTYGATSYIQEAAYVSQNSTSNSVVTTWNAGGVLLSQTVILPADTSQYIKVNWSITNNSGFDINNVHFLRGLDSYLSGGDAGAGFWDAATNTVGATKTLGGVVQRLGFQGVTVPNSYSSKEFSSVGAEVTDGGTLSNTIDPTPTVDNGYALEWSEATLSNGETWIIKTYESFVAAPVTVSGGDVENSTGGAVTLTFTVSNKSGSSQNVTYSATVPSGWSAAILSIASETIANNGSSSVTVTVDPPDGAATDVYDITLTALTSGGDSDGVGQVNFAPPLGPLVSDPNISITSTPTGTSSTYKIGDTVTATWNNTAGGDNQSGITGVTMDFSAFGGGAAVTATNDGSGNWTASYPIVAGSIDGTSKNVSVTATNGSGSTTTADTTNLTVDNQAPTVTDGGIAISGATGSGGAYKIGDTVTATWNNTVGGDNNTDTISGVTADFSAFGGGAAVAASNSGGTWTATYTIVAGAIDGTNKNVSFTATDNAGNTTTTADTTNATLDNVAPTVTDANLSISGATGTGGAFKIGDTVTATWNNTGAGDNNTDTISGVTVDFSQFGGGSAVAATNSGGTWTATYTIVAGAINGTTNRNVSATATDNAGNTTTTADTSNATVDNVAPTLTNSTMSFSADTGSSSTDFITKTDAQTISGTLSGVTTTGDIVQVSLDNGSTWTTASNTIGQNTWSLAGQTLTASNTLQVRVTDAAGNPGTAATQAYVLDTTAPSITAVSIPNTTMKVGAGVTATITVADDGGSTYTLGSSTLGGFTLGSLARTDSTTYTASFTVTEGGTDVAAGSDIPVSLVLTDPAGNSSTAYTTAISQAGDAINAHSPTDIALSNNSVATITGVNAVVGALSSTDATTGETFAYSLVAGAGSTDNASFNIDSGNLLANDSSALTAGNSYSVRVRTTDAAGNTYEEAMTVNAVVGPAIASATYDASTGVLTVTGSLMEVMTGADNDIAVNKFTLTGEGGTTYILTSSNVEITSATEFSVTLNATDKAAVNQILNKNGTTSTGGTTFNLAAADDWNANVTTGDTSDATNTVTVANVPAPTITSATYDYATNTLVVTGTGFIKLTGPTNDIDISKLSFTGEGGASYTLTSASDVEIDSATQFTVTLSGSDLTNFEALLNKDGTASVGGTTYNLAAAEDWAAGAAAAVNVVDTTGNGITVSNWAAPAITSATYDWTTGQLVLTGTNFVNTSGATNDLTANLLSLTGEGGSYTLTDSANVEITSATSATVTLSATDRLNVHGLLNKNGTQSSAAVTYNLAAADNWMAGSPAASDIADTTGNGITVSNVATPTITSATYDSDTGVLVVTGTNLFKKSGATNDIDISTLTFTGGTGSATYTLTSASDVEITSSSSFSTTLSGADKTNVDALLDQMGTVSTGGSTYNLAAGEDWLAGADAAANIADASNAVTVSISPRITSATYNATTGLLVVTGTNMQVNGGGADVDASKLTLTGEGGVTYTLTDTTDVERDSATQFTLILSATDKAALNQIVNQAGTASRSATTYNLAAADDWNTQVTTGDTTDASNAVIVSNVPAPAITSATYDASTGALVVTGTGFLKLSGAINDINVSKLTITGEGGETRTLTTSSVEITSGTAFTVTLNAADQAAVNQILNKVGTTATSGTTYNLAAAEDWTAGAAAGVTDADLTGNGVTVSNPTTPTITSATYNALTGVLALTGTGFLKLSGATNDIVANKFTITGEANTTHTLTDTANVEITSVTAATLTLSSTDKAAVNALINKTGTASNDNTTYNLAAAEDWAAGAAAAVNVADLTGNGITATLNQAPVITSNGGIATAAINVAENSTAVTTVTATDADAGQTASYSITGGADQAKFSIVANTGVLTFASAPNFEVPTDADTNNTYIVDVGVSDANGGTDVQTITVTVTDVNETPPPSPTPTPTPEPTPEPTPTPTVDGTTVTTDTTTNLDGTTTTTQTVAPVTATRPEDPNTPNTALADIPLVNDSTGQPLVQVGLPVGVGFTASATTGSTLTLREQLIQASEPRVDDNAEMTRIIDNGIDQFVPTVQDESQVTVRTITLTVPAGTTTPSAQPIIITGASGTGESDPANPQRQEALIIDASQLPPGTVLQFDKVEFAIVIGPGTVLGGEGRNYLIGDNATQFIVLGPDDDILRGGGGDDTVGSKGGKDQLFGDDGNDHLVGGNDADTLHGGAGNDILQGGQSDAGIMQFSLDTTGRMHVLYTAESAYLTETGTITFADTWTRSASERGQIDQRVGLIEYDYAHLKDISLLYYAMTNALPTADALRDVAATGLSSGSLADLAFRAYQEAYAPDFAGQAQTTQIRALVKHVLGTESSSAVTDVEQILAAGGDWGDALNSLAQAKQYTIEAFFFGNIWDSNGNFKLTQDLKLSESGWSADSSNDILYGGEGNDYLVGGAGNDVLDGGTGVDIAVYSGVLEDFGGRLVTQDGITEIVIFNRISGDQDIIRAIEGVKIGATLYGGNGHAPQLVAGQDYALSDFVTPVGVDEIKAMGLPDYWVA